MNEVIVFITASHEDEAAKIARALLEAKLAGCVNIIRNIRSLYSWEGEIHDETEVLMIAKTQKHLLDAFTDKAKELHSYTVPEIIAMQIDEGSAEYLKWLKEVTD
jgi:periplasmic divalent cation tolerance protein